MGCTAQNGNEKIRDIADGENTLAQTVVDRAIKAHGVDRLNRSLIEFDFRGRHYISRRNGGMFQYERIFPDTVDGMAVQVRDVLDNESFRRYVDDREMPVSEKMQGAYSNSINSVLYFAQQPFFLNDPAVRKEYLGESLLGGEPYHKIKITFRQEGGGKDFEDVFIYFFHKDRYTMDYFAYYYETDGGGLRFRKAYNVQTIEGIMFSDFINYQADFSSYTVEDLDQLYNQGLLEELSRIENQHIVVRLQHPE